MDIGDRRATSAIEKVCRLRVSIATMSGTHFSARGFQRVHGAHGDTRSIAITGNVTTTLVIEQLARFGLVFEWMGWLANSPNMWVCSECKVVCERGCLGSNSSVGVYTATYTPFPSALREPVTRVRPFSFQALYTPSKDARALS